MYVVSSVFSIDHLPCGVEEGMSGRRFGDIDVPGIASKSVEENYDHFIPVLG